MNEQVTELGHLPVYNWDVGNGCGTGIHKNSVMDVVQEYIKTVYPRSY